MKYLPIIALLLMTINCQNKKSSQGENFLDNVNKVEKNIVDDSGLLTFFDRPRDPVTPEFQLLPTGSTKPKGWLLKMMKNDLNRGIVGALDDLYPGIKADDLYRTDRRGGMEDIPEMGDLALTGAEWETSIMWWNAETSGNWWDGFMRHAFLTGDEKAMAQAREIVENLLASQDEGGYIGIYKPNLRYQHEGANGELWAQTTAFRTLLAYYELTKEERVLNAVEKAMAVTMKHYNKGTRNPFDLKSAFGGVTHGLMLTDVCETLHRITGKIVYQEYAVYLYRAFSTYSINRSFNDIRYPFLVKRDSLFSGHGVHTYEHLRTLLNAYYQTGYPELEQAWNNSLYKLDFCLLPSGAGHGNEWIAKQKADPTLTSTEFCTMLELRNFFCSAIPKTGDIAFADAAEKLTFNGMMGFRNEEGTALTYGKGDNCYVLDSRHHHGPNKGPKDPRYKYSPTHSDPAVCCVPNYTRNFTYYLDYMWGKAENGLVAMLYGPSLLKTSINGVEIEIKQVTNYPFSDQIEFRLTCSEGSEFSIYFRKPQWANSIDIEAKDVVMTVENGFYKATKLWKPKEVVRLSFDQEIKAIPFKNEVYFQRGPLVFAYPIPHREEAIKQYEIGNFRDYHCFPENDDFEYLSLSKAADANGIIFNQEEMGENENLWYSGKTYLTGEMYHGKTGKVVQVKLYPMGSTVLRRVTFPVDR